MTRWVLLTPLFRRLPFSILIFISPYDVIYSSLTLSPITTFEFVLLMLTPLPATVPWTLTPPAPVFVIFTTPLPEIFPALAIFTPSTPVFSIVTSPVPKFLRLP